MANDPAMMSSTIFCTVFMKRDAETKKQKLTMKLRWIAITLIGALAMFVTSAYAGTTKKGYVFSDHPTYIWEFRNRTKGRDFAGAMRMINEKKVYPLKEGLDVVVIEVIQGGIVRFRLRSTPVGFFTTKGTHYTAIEAIQQ